MAENTNGVTVYSNDRAQYGYISTDKFLVVTTDTVRKAYEHWSGPRAPKVDLNVLGKAYGITSYVGLNSTAYQASCDYLVETSGFEIVKLAALNYYFLTNSRDEMRSEVAGFVSCLRARWIALGALYTNDPNTLSDPEKLFNETIVVEPNPAGDVLQRMAACTNQRELFTAMGAKAVPFVTALRSEEYGLKRATMDAEVFWSISEYLFRTRGHHYKEENEALIAKIYSAHHEAALNLDYTFPYADVFHTAIHPFGVKALAVMAAHFAAHSKLGQAVLLRFNAAPNGLAVITTSKAALDALATEVWYADFKAMYREAIELVEVMGNYIVDNKYAFHMSARLYGLQSVTNIAVNGKSYTLDEAKAKAGIVATVAQGFINALNNQKRNNSITSYTFENAKCLEKHAAVNPLMSARISLLIALSVSLVAESKSMLPATTSIFPLDKTKDKE